MERGSDWRREDDQNERIRHLIAGYTHNHDGYTTRTTLGSAPRQTGQSPLLAQGWPRGNGKSKSTGSIASFWGGKPERIHRHELDQRLLIFGAFLRAQQYTILDALGFPNVLQRQLLLFLLHLVMLV